MLVSVIIPTYKRSDRLNIAVKSILNQTYSPIEIIVVDDNGENEFRAKTELGLQSFIKKNKIKYIKLETNKGACEARNIGAKEALGDFISFLDDDDFYEPTKIEIQVNELNTNSKIDACLCGMYRINEKNENIDSTENFPRGNNLKEAILNGNIFTSMLMIKKDIFISIGGFSNIPRFQDRYFLFKFFKNDLKLSIVKNQLLTLVEHSSERISLTSSEKIIQALEILHDFENRNKKLFSKKEWKYIKDRYYYMKAYNLILGGISGRIKAILCIVNSIPYYTGNFNIFKIFIKIFIP